MNPQRDETTSAASGPDRTRHGFANAEITVGVLLLGAVVLSCVLVPVASPYGPNELVAPAYLAPSSSHPFGTDSVGRDVMTRVFQAGRLDLAITAFVIATASLIGTVVGTFAGLLGGRVDAVLMRLVDGLIAFPFVILILVLVVLIGPTRTIGPLPAGVPATVVAFAVVGWAYYGRLARSHTLAIRQLDYVVAARTLGYSNSRIVVRHLMPSVARVTGTYAVGDAVIAVIAISSLSFLGAGVAQPTAEWGNMMFEGRTFLSTAWWITVAPGVMLAVTGTSLSVLADGLFRGRAVSL